PVHSTDTGRGAYWAVEGRPHSPRRGVGTVDNITEGGSEDDNVGSAGDDGAGDGGVPGLRPWHRRRPPRRGRPRRRRGPERRTARPAPIGTGRLAHRRGGRRRRPRRGRDAPRALPAGDAGAQRRRRATDAPDPAPDLGDVQPQLGGG